MSASATLTRRAFLCLCATALTVVTIPLAPTSAFAFSKPGHDNLIQGVLFGWTKRTADTEKTSEKNRRPYGPQDDSSLEKLDLLENATALCLDQFNGNDEGLLGELQSEKIRGVPSSIADIDLQTNGKDHRYFTHMGWHYDYEKDGIEGKTKDECAEWNVRWIKRKAILVNTVDSVFNFGAIDTIKTWVPFIPNDGTKADAFAELLYVIHVIGDYEHGINKLLKDNDNISIAENRNYKLKVIGINLVNLNENGSSRCLFDDLNESLAALVDTSSTDYAKLADELDLLTRKARRIGSVTSKEKADEFKSAIVDLEDCLANYVPKLLSKCEFFTNVFGKSQS